MTHEQGGWIPAIRKSGKPLYLEIADAIADDVASGRLSANDRLPPQRWLADRLALNFSTVSRAYVEAQRRGLIDSRVGQGTFVRTPSDARPASRSGRPAPMGDMTMNLPPEPADPALLERMSEGVGSLRDQDEIRELLRYQGFGGSVGDRAAGAAWLAPLLPHLSAEQVLVCPGAQSAILAALTSLARAGDVVCCEELAYPGFRSLAIQLGIALAGLPMDAEGIDPDAFAYACRTRGPKALYLNPTLHNPTTVTMSVERRLRVAAIAKQYGVPIIEDDAYGMLPATAPPPIAALAPDVVYYIGGLAKYLGAGLRIAYAVPPSLSQYSRFLSALRATSMMASPITATLAARWIEDGTAHAVLDFVRAETAARQKLVSAILPQGAFVTKPEAFHLWLTLPPQWGRVEFLLHLRALGVGLVASDSFAVTAPIPEAARLCIGGPIDRDQLSQTLTVLAHTLRQSPAVVSAVI